MLALDTLNQTEDLKCYESIFYQRLNGQQNQQHLRFSNNETIRQQQDGLKLIKIFDIDKIKKYNQIYCEHSTDASGDENLENSPYYYQSQLNTINTKDTTQKIQDFNNSINLSDPNLSTQYEGITKQTKQISGDIHEMNKMVEQQRNQSHSCITQLQYQQIMQKNDENNHRQKNHQQILISNFDSFATFINTHYVDSVLQGISPSNNQQQYIKEQAYYQNEEFQPNPNFFLYPEKCNNTTKTEFDIETNIYIHQLTKKLNSVYDDVNVVVNVEEDQLKKDIQNYDSKVIINLKQCQNSSQLDGENLQQDIFVQEMEIHHDHKIEEQFIQPSLVSGISLEDTILRPIKRIIKKKRTTRQSIYISHYKNKRKNFNCRYCERSFTQATALGGHMSKAHPRMSDHYMYKQEIRQSRESDRELLTRAKDIYYGLYNDDKITNRSKINYIKQLLQQGLNLEEIIAKLQNLQ
ncbi:UNKNOWN [Stylonychia lemnae]|uniref:C2H2-type domain-containing protein n=1 Tax=Stylonychia lemnae TaxID=5949 RepID=A0A078AHU3_STYLE|nr:UNKNOWN [Stylonychia lemnae]|eukprot:CDW81461.1 UNKNOWN [Stylonychia lemnae]